MKFGHNLPRNEVPEWSTSYIQYKTLKKLIKAAAVSVQEGHTADLAGTHEIDALVALLTVLQSSPSPLIGM
jgi:SPX domain protein involved in polyphosphate accumulation